MKIIFKHFGRKQQFRLYLPLCNKVLRLVKLRLGGQTICTIQTILYMMVYCDILRTMTKTKKYDASNRFCVLALSIHCFEILILLARHGDSKNDFWRYTLVHNFCPPLKFQPENEVVGHYAICVSKQSSQYPPLGGESFFQNFGP